MNPTTSTRRRSLAVLAALAAIALTLAACGGGSKDDSASAKKKADDKGDLAAASTDDGSSTGDAGEASSDGAAASADGKTAVGTDGKKTDASTSANASGGTTTTIPPEIAAQLKKFEGDWIAGAPVNMSSDEPVPPNCRFKEGQVCQIKVQGTYGLKSKDVAQIFVGAYDDDHTEADFHVTLPNAVKPGTRWYIDKFPYTARPGVKKTTFLVKLLDAGGKELAKGDPYTYDFEFIRSH